MKLIRCLFLIVILFIITGCRNTSFSNAKDNTIEISNEIEVKEDKVDTNFEVHFIDVGQGDSALVICDDKYMLIDGGPSSASQILYTYLKDLDIKFLDYIICTHPDEDHVGGLSGALNYADVGVAYSSGSQDTRAYNSFVTYVDKSGSYIEKPTISSTFNLGSSEIEILASNIGLDNDQSIVLKIKYGNTSFLFTGDAELLTEEFLIDNKDINCDVLKVSHHGSNTATSEKFLEKANPKYAVISVGKYNTYGHPTTEVLDRLANNCIDTYRTDLDGDIIIYSDGNDLIIKTEKDGKRLSRDIKRNVDSSVEYKYCLNTSSMKIHYVDCDSVYDMSDENKLYTNEEREVLISKGYKPCGKCNP